jgi:hypothetical protein
MEFIVPESLKTEHAELHERLETATRAGGKTGARAQEVVRVLHPHFVKEEEFALPPLGILRSLASGTVSPDMQDVLRLTERLKRDLPIMIREHEEIVKALEALRIAAEEEGKPAFIDLADAITHHARTEEEVMYPVAILVGEYVKLKMGSAR